MRIPLERTIRSTGRNCTIAWIVLAAMMFAAALLAATATHAQSVAPPVRTPHVEAQLIASLTSITPGVPFTVGLLLRMEPGWHTYWRNPGDAGMATSIAWKLPPGTRADSLRWPAPELIGDPPEVTYAFSNVVLLQTVIHPPASISPGSTFTIGGTASWLVCKEICLPGKAELTLSIPVHVAPAPADSLWNAIISSAKLIYPGTTSPAGISALLRDGVIDVRINASAVPAIAGAYTVQFFAADEAVIDHSAAQKFAMTHGALTLSLPVSSYATKAPKRLRGVLKIETSTKTTLITEIDVPIVKAGKRGN